MFGMADAKKWESKRESEDVARYLARIKETPKKTRRDQKLPFNK